jgi:uncharacterized protein with HEPN domain
VLLNDVLCVEGDLVAYVDRGAVEAVAFESLALGADGAQDKVECVGEACRQVPQSLDPILHTRCGRACGLARCCARL